MKVKGCNGRKTTAVNLSYLSMCGNLTGKGGAVDDCFKELPFTSINDLDC